MSTTTSPGSSRPRPATRARVALSMLAILGVVEAEAPAAQRVVQSPRDGGSVALVSGPGGALVVESGGAARRIELPPGAALSTVSLAVEGWIGAGTVEDRGGTELLLLESREGRDRRLPAPAGARSRLRQGPALFVEAGRLAGLAWLEGTRTTSLAVRAAPWQGAGWGPTETVARSGPGSQLALSGALLADGSWLLVWSAFDGEDDEIQWSRRTAEGWSAPARLHADNAVPDITPTVAARGVGAFAAWSRFDDGHYRLRVARFDGREWTEAEFRGEPGSLLPGFVAAGDDPRLLYRTVEPATWTLVRLGPDGRPWRRLVVPAAGPERPLVEGSGSRAVLRWLSAEGATLRRVTERWEAVP